MLRAAPVPALRQPSLCRCLIRSQSVYESMPDEGDEGDEGNPHGSGSADLSIGSRRAPTSTALSPHSILQDRDWVALERRRDVPGILKPAIVHLTSFGLN